MQDESWEAAGRRLIEGWLASIGPFGPVGAVPGGGTADPLLHLHQFAEVLAQAAARQQSVLDPNGDLHATVVDLFEGLSVQLSVLRKTLVDAPPMDWGAAWGQATHPILGPWREVHGKSLRLQAAMNAVTEAGRSLQRMHLDVLARALDTCRAKLRETGGPTIDSVRGLFDWWVAVVDAAYRDAAFTDDYAEAFAQAVNAASELRLATRALDTLWPGSAMFGGPVSPPERAAPATAPATEPDVAPKVHASPQKVHAKPPESSAKPSASRKPRPARAAATAREKPDSSMLSGNKVRAPLPEASRAAQKPGRVKRAVSNDKLATSTPVAPKHKAPAARGATTKPRARQDEFDIGRISPTRK